MDYSLMRQLRFKFFSSKFFAIAFKAKDIILVENIFICWNRNFALVSPKTFLFSSTKGIDRDESPLKVDTPAERSKTTQKQ